MLKSDVIVLENLTFTDQTGRMLTKMDDIETLRSGFLYIEQSNLNEHMALAIAADSAASNNEYNK